ncbi:MAG: imidazoleglycerol-phosphate dehydratase [Syntrophobacterales bacterium CG23_combo_of_CG06-09_8_20_14_all_48_27]|nr:MAG: imidazoleglycerol-phosphate dehydratase [Syntrophobacterales bacterium CG23_combo_of_CG06-09_8_20_14_all_48_27]
MKRMGKVYRKTTETEVSVEITLNGRGRGEITTTIPFLDHMLDLFAKHGLFDLTVKSKGDTAIDDHHLVEDIGICLGEAIKEALGDKKGIERYGSAVVPMDESLCSVAVDISGRPYLIYNADFGNKKIRDFDPALLREFFKSFSDHSGITLHINLIYGKNNHHIAEAIFKAFARAIREASSLHDRIKGVLSTKGSL